MEHWPVEDLAKVGHSPCVKEDKVSEGTKPNMLQEVSKWIQVHESPRSFKNAAHVNQIPTDATGISLADQRGYAHIQYLSPWPIKTMLTSPSLENCSL